jgi:hypothetical protein
MAPGTVPELEAILQQLMLVMRDIFRLNESRSADVHFERCRPWKRGFGCWRHVSQGAAFLAAGIPYDERDI